MHIYVCVVCVCLSCIVAGIVVLCSCATCFTLTVPVYPNVLNEYQQFKFCGKSCDGVQLFQVMQEGEEVFQVTSCCNGNWQ